MTAAMGNQIPLVATPPAAGAAGPVKAGALRGLAIASEKRIVPTYGENGYPGFVASAWTGFFLPTKTSDEIADKLNVAINEILKIPKCPRASKSSALSRSALIKNLPRQCFERTSANGDAWSRPSISNPNDRSMCTMSALHPKADMCSATSTCLLCANSELMQRSKKDRYSINSSAVVRSDAGTVRPSAFAVLRLITISNLVGCSTGRSAGFMPLRIRSTYEAARRYKST